MNLTPHCKSCEDKIKKHCQFRLVCSEEKPYEFEDLAEERFKLQGNCCHKCNHEAEMRVKHRPQEENEGLISSIVSKLTARLSDIYGKSLNIQETKQLEGYIRVKDPGWYNKIPKEGGMFNNRTIKRVEEQGI